MLTNLSLLRLNNTNLQGCYPDCMIAFCTQLNDPDFDGNTDISNGNNFDATWEDFCNSGSGICPVSNPQCHISDWTALKALYESTDGDNWTNNNGWQEVTGVAPTANCNLANLYGIGLDNTGRVSCIDLDGEDNCAVNYTYVGGNNLTGNIPSGLVLLSNLTLLNFKQNSLNGSIPAVLGSLSNLEELVLWDNELSGNIPPELGNLVNLTTLILSGNQLNGSIPAEFGNLTNVTNLSLAINQLSGSIPPELSNMTSLLYLRQFKQFVLFSFE